MFERGKCEIIRYYANLPLTWRGPT